MEIKKKEKKTKQIAFMVYPSIDEKLQKIADKEGVSRVIVIEQLVIAEWETQKEGE